MYEGTLIVAGLALVVGIVMLSNTVDKNAAPTQPVFNTICLDGIEYWYRQTGYKGMLAPRFSKDTLTVTTC